MKTGDRINVQASRNDIIERMVVAVGRGKVYLCPLAEFKLAELERREPWSIGFSMADIIEDMSSEKKSMV